MVRMAKNLNALQYIMNVNDGRQNIASFISPAKRTIKSIDRSIDREDREHQILEFLYVFCLNFQSLKHRFSE